MSEKASSQVYAKDPEMNRVVAWVQIGMIFFTILLVVAWNITGSYRDYIFFDGTTAGNLHDFRLSETIVLFGGFTTLSLIPRVIMSFVNDLRH